MPDGLPDWEAFDQSQHLWDNYLAGTGDRPLRRCAQSSFYNIQPVRSSQIEWLHGPPVLSLETGQLLYPGRVAKGFDLPDTGEMALVSNMRVVYEDCYIGGEYLPILETCYPSGYDACESTWAQGHFS